MKSILILLLLLVSEEAFCKKWSIANNNIEVKFDDQTGLLEVKDKRCSKVWQQSFYKDALTVRNTIQKGNSLIVNFSGKYSFEVTLILNEAALEFTIAANNTTAIETLEFPAAFYTTDRNHYLLYTDGGGFLLPITDQDYPVGNGVTYFCGGGLSMGWMGITDTAFKSGYMAILETPFDAALTTKRENGLVTFSPIWMASMGEFGYSRKVTYHFFDKGGYVAQCKKYRDYAWNKNKVITLKENEKKTPALGKMMGAPHIYVWDNARNIDFARELKQAGIEKAMFLWDANHTPYPEADFDTRLKELGYATAVYELFTDLKIRDTAFSKATETGPLRFALTSYPGMFNELAARKKDGKTYFNQFGHTSCPVAIRQQMYKRIERELKEYAHEAYFLDVYQANGLFECYAPEHRLTRQQFAEAVNENYKMIAAKYGQYMGGEWGADFTGSNSVFVHGMMTLQRTWFGSDINKKGTIYWYGDWKNNPRPSQMLGVRTAPDKYLKYSINEYTRVPLYELVYHDAVVTSWRWEDGNHHNPEIWWKKDLYNILYGSAPLWNVDRERWESFKNTFIQSYKNVCPWVEKIGYDEMVAHRFLTADHKLQETSFSSGKKVWVNFSDNKITYQGKDVAQRGYLFFE